jgi:RNA polymerase sporulation-specific sigma factor
MKKWFTAIWLKLCKQNTVYYIGGADVLPPPLKGEDEQVALADLENGDENAKQLLNL